MDNLPAIPDCIDNAVKNLTDKSTASIGQTIADLWQLVLGGRIALAAEKQRLKYAQDLEKYRETLEEKVAAIPEDKQTEPTMQIAAQALQDSQYCIGSEELREMFANLIARSMHTDYLDKIHPSFSKIVQQLSPLDAQMLTIFYRNQTKSGVAIADYIGRESNGGFSPIFENVSELLPDDCHPAKAARAIISLQRQGLVEIPFDMYIKEPGRYDVFYNCPLYDEASEVASKWGYALEIKKRVGKLTIFGEDFVRVCLG